MPLRVKGRHTLVSSAQGTTGHLVSVAVPVYNVEHYLAQCLDSIRSSLGKQLQVVIVNDGSTDGSLAIAEAFAQRAESDPHLPDVSIVTKPNGGYGAAVNRGFDESDGMYVGIVEPDDYLAGDLFGELYAIAEASDMPDIVKSTYKRVWMPDTPQQRIWGSLLRHRGVRTWRRGCTNLGESPLLVRWHPSVWSAIYRRDFLTSTGTRFIEAPGAGWVDNPFVMRAMCQADRIAFTDDAWYCYREDRPGSSSVTKAPTLSLTRWLQMAEEVAQSRWATDEGVLTSLASIGFRYASHLWNTPEARDPEVTKLLECVLGAIPLDIALSLDDVSPAAKQRYLDATHQNGDIGKAMTYHMAMIRELLYSWRENGMFFACERAGLHRHPAKTQHIS